MNLKDIGKPVQEHLDEFNDFFKDSMKSDVSLLNLIIDYVLKKKGKRVRPTLVFLSAEISGSVSHRSYIGASMVELLHTATLIHDDVVDEASERRGMASINASWNNKIAILIGDYLLAKGLLSAIDDDEFYFLKILATAVRRMSEGELLQIRKSWDFDTDEDTYFRIISDKTASLMASCCEIGSYSASDNPEYHRALRNYGENVGLAFQIRDDIFDYISKGFTIGKPVGNDLREKKLTLPLIYALQQADKKDGKKIKGMIKKGKLSKDIINHIVDFVKLNGGIDYAEKSAKELYGKAVKELEIFEDNEAKESLVNFAKFVVEREK